MGNVKIEIENPPQKTLFSHLQEGALFISPANRNGKVFRKIEGDSFNAENILTVAGCIFGDEEICHKIEVTGLKVKLL